MGLNKLLAENERDYYKTYSEDFAQRIEELKRENEELQQYKREVTRDCTECFYAQDIKIEKLKEENEKLKQENAWLSGNNNTLTNENEKLKTEIEELKRKLQQEKQKADGYKNNAEIILPDAEKIKSEARAELAEAKLKLTDLEKIVKEVRKFVDGALKLEVPGSPVYCLLRGMKEVLEVA